MPEKPKRPRKGNGEEFRFKIDAYSPATIPMLRLAEYMHQLALILGETSHVHFRRVVKGSTSIVHVVERESVPKVRDRIRHVREGDGPSEAMQAFGVANRMLRDDNAVASWKNGAVILQFPGREQTQEEFTAVRQHGFVDGEVTGVRGKDQTVHLTLQIEGKQVSGFETNRAIAKQIGGRMWEPVRLFGKGKWRRDNEGTWNLETFKVEGFEFLDAASLPAALSALRAIPTDWTDDAYGELLDMRRGPKGNRNGGH